MAARGKGAADGKLSAQELPLRYKPDQSSGTLRTMNVMLLGITSFAVVFCIMMFMKRTDAVPAQVYVTGTVPAVQVSKEAIAQARAPFIRKRVPATGVVSAMKPRFGAYKLPGLEKGEVSVAFAKKHFVVASLKNFGQETYQILSSRVLKDPIKRALLDDRFDAEGEALKMFSDLSDTALPAIFGIGEGSKLAPSKDGLWVEVGKRPGLSTFYPAKLNPDVQLRAFHSSPTTGGKLTDAEAKLRQQVAVLEKAVPNVRLQTAQNWNTSLAEFASTHPDDPVTFLHVDTSAYEDVRDVLVALEEHLAPGCLLVFQNFPPGEALLRDLRWAGDAALWALYRHLDRTKRTLEVIGSHQRSAVFRLW